MPGERHHRSVPLVPPSAPSLGELLAVNALTSKRSILPALSSNSYLSSVTSGTDSAGRACLRKQQALHRSSFSTRKIKDSVQPYAIPQLPLRSCFYTAWISCKQARLSCHATFIRHSPHLLSSLLTMNTSEWPPRLSSPVSATPPPTPDPFPRDTKSHDSSQCP